MTAHCVFPQSKANFIKVEGNSISLFLLALTGLEERWKSFLMWNMTCLLWISVFSQVSPVQPVQTLLKVPKFCSYDIPYFPGYLCYCILVGHTHCPSLPCNETDVITAHLWSEENIFFSAKFLCIPAAVCYRGESLGPLSINIKQDKHKYTFSSSWCDKHLEMFIILLILHKQKVGWLQITARNTAARYPPEERPYSMLPWKIHLRESSLAAIQPVLAAVPQKQFRPLLFCRKLLSIPTVSSSLTAFSSCFTLWFLFLILFFFKKPWIAVR